MSRIAAFSPLATSIAVLAVFALLVGGVIVVRRGDRTRGVLMLACAVVIMGNVLIWTL
ncbi:hypothetical protein ACX40Y_16050 [Sphingomonas sp. RS6]